MASDVDNDGRLTATKALTIIFIFAILLTSACPIVTLLRRHGLVMDVRRLFVITLTMGGILLALFPLVIKAHFLFDSQSHASISCDIPVMATIYESFYYPFVYATGLIFIAFHLIVEQKTNYCFHKQSPFFAFLIIISPWLLGLVLVLPIMMAGIHWDNDCLTYFSKGRLIAQIWISLLPVIGVVAVGIAVLICVTSGTTTVPSSCDSNPPEDSSSSNQVVYLNGPQTELVVIPTGTLHRVGSRDRSRHSHHNNMDPRCSYLAPSAPPAIYDVERMTSPLPYDQERPLPPLRYDVDRPPLVPKRNDLNRPLPPLPYHEYDFERPPSVHHYRYPQPQPYVAPIHDNPPQQPFYPLGDQYHPQNSRNHNINPYFDSVQTNHPPIPPPPSFRNPPAPVSSRTDDVSENANHRRDNLANDKKVFLRVVVIFFLCSFPAPIFNLGYSLNDARASMETSTVMVIVDFIYWISVVRWLVLPLCWWFMK